MKIAVLWTLVGGAANAAYIDPSPPLITPRAIAPQALEPRAGVLTLGWSSSTTDVEHKTIWSASTYDPSSSSFYISGSVFRGAPFSSSTWPIYTTCSGDYLLAASTSAICTASSMTCSSHLLIPTSGGPTSYSWFWCDQTTLKGWTLYITSPTTATETSTPSSTASTSSSTASASATSSPSHSSNVGIIAGATVGGVAVLAAFILGLVFILRRKRRNAQADTNHPATTQYNDPSVGGHTPAVGHLSMASPAYSPVPAYETFDKPVGVGTSNYDKGGFNPHVGQHEVSEVAGSTPAPPTIPAGEYSSPTHEAELPATARDR